MSRCCLVCNDLHGGAEISSTLPAHNAFESLWHQSTDPVHVQCTACFPVYPVCEFPLVLKCTHIKSANCQHVLILYSTLRIAAVKANAATSLCHGNTTDFYKAEPARTVTTSNNEREVNGTKSLPEGERRLCGIRARGT